MKSTLQATAQSPTAAVVNPANIQLATAGLLQRKCECGANAEISDECEGCQRDRLLGKRPPLWQAKLAINEAGDPYEQEADRIADQIMHIPSSGEVLPRKRFVGRIGLQRRARPPASAEEGTLQTAETPEARPYLPTDTISSIAGMQGGGLTLPLSERAFFEPRFGFDFGHVRVHADIRAAQTARSVHARAFAFGRDVVFGAGQYAPGTEAGRRLLAHELTHVVQQAHQGALGSHQMLQRETSGSRPPRTQPAQRLEFRPAIHPSLLGGPCACLVFIHNNERNAREAAEYLHQNCRYNLAIIGPGRSRNVPIRGGNRQVDPNELFPADVQEECTRDEPGCVAYERGHHDLRAMQIQFFLAIKTCSKNFGLPTIALHNNSIADTRTFLRTSSETQRESLRGDFSRETGEGVGSREDLRRRLGRRRGIMTRSGTTNIFRWCNLPEIGRCHIGDPDHPDDVVWVTNTQDFERLRQEDVNVVLQEGLGATGGSESETDLSTLFLRLGTSARFINIETPISPRDQASRDRNMSFIQGVLDHIGLNCCEPIGDFPTPSRTELIA
jgi:hypothetical protein